MRGPEVGKRGWPVPRVEAPRPSGLEPSHPRHRIGLGRLHQEMGVVGHQHIRKHPLASPVAHLPERSQKAPLIRGIPADRLSAIPMANT